MLSEDALLGVTSSSGGAGLSEADLPTPGILQGFGGTEDSDRIRTVIPIESER
jgi:hypothetical protein